MRENRGCTADSWGTTEDTSSSSWEPTSPAAARSVPERPGGAAGFSYGDLVDNVPMVAAMAPLWRWMQHLAEIPFLRMVGCIYLLRGCLVSTYLQLNLAKELVVLPSLLGVSLTTDFCRWARLQMQRQARRLDSQAQVREDWQLQPPLLQESYDEWCQSQTAMQTVDWLVLLMQIGFQWSIMQKEHCGLSHHALSTVSTTLTLLRLGLRGWLSVGSLSMMNVVNLAARSAYIATLVLQRDECFQSTLFNSSTSVLGLAVGTGFFVMESCVFFPVTLQLTYPTVAILSTTGFATRYAHFCVLRRNSGLATDPNGWGILVCAVAASLTAQMCIVFRGYIGMLNFRAFCKTHLLTGAHSHAQ